MKSIHVYESAAEAIRLAGALVSNSRRGEERGPDLYPAESLAVDHLRKIFLELGIFNDLPESQRPVALATLPANDLYRQLQEARRGKHPEAS